MADIQCYLASHMGAVYSICDGVKMEKHRLSMFIYLLYCLLFYSEVEDDSTVAFCFWVNAVGFQFK